MMAAHIASEVFLVLAVVVVLVSALGVTVMPDVYTKLHYVTPLTVIAPPLVALAVTADRGISQNALQSWMAVVALIVAGPLLSHATLRAARIRERGDWRATTPGPDQPVPDDRGSG